MQLSFVSVRRAMAGAVVAAFVWCGQASAQVLDQIPSNAMAVLKIKSLEKTNAKVAKLAKAFGLDEIQPDMKDPLSALLQKGHISQGINKAGDAAVVLYFPEKEGDEPVGVGLVPVSDYQAFLGNFKKHPGADAQGPGVTAVLDPENAAKTIFIANRGGYAVMSDKNSHLVEHGGLKLTATVAREAEEKDLVFFFNMPVIREKALPEMKKHRGEWADNMHKSLANQEQLKKFAPVFDTLLNTVVDGAEEFLRDANGIVFSLNIGDTGLMGGAVVDFAPTSKCGQMIASLRPGSTPLLAGLPDKKYLFVGGMSVEGHAFSDQFGEWIAPINKDLRKTDSPIGKQIADVMDAAKTIMAASTHSAAGWVVPTKPLGQESIFQQVSVTYGDAKVIHAAEKKVLGDVSELMSLAPNQGGKAKIEFGEPRNIDGATLESYTTKIEVDPNDPKGAQAQQMLAMLYGPKGMAGEFGAVSDKVFIMTQAVDDELLKEVISAAKSQKDALSDNAGIKSVASQLPGNRVLVYYVALDNIVSTVVRYAQGFGLPIKLKLPQNLPPVGVAAGSEGSALRIDGFVPTETVQSLIAAGLQAYTQMQGGGGGGL